ncbi:MAG: YceI family protein [Flavobacteriaceae bacterium]|nr:YceI family protein [Flavobacteriaceae bacterium]
MKKRYWITALCLLLTLVSKAQFEVVAKNSTIQWTGYGAIGNYSLSGDLKIKSGAFETYESGVLKQGSVVFDMKTISHDNKTLVKHLKSDDFFAVKQYPTARFEIDSVNSENLIGRLTMRGITKNIEVPYTLVGAGETLLLKGKVLVDRTGFGIRYNSSSFFKNLGSNAIKNDFEVIFELELTAR